MPNQTGANQTSPFTVTAPYGDIKRQSQLSKESPISGSPFAAHAMETARRDKKQATRGSSPVPQPLPAGPQAPVQPSNQFQVSTAWQNIAAVPGASPLVQEMARRANG